MTDFPLVSVWKKLPSGWGKVTELHGWETLACEPRHLQPGTWSLRMPYDAQASKLTAARLVTVDFRSQRLMTGLVEQLAPQSDAETGQPVLEASGVDALALLSDVLCWPVPGNALTNQTSEYYVATGAAETVLRDLIQANVVTRRADDVSVDVSLGRGTSVTLRLRFDNLLAILEEKGERGGIGARMGLVDTTGTRATMTVSFYEPVDKSDRVRLSHDVGTLRSWTHSDEAPTVTRAIVGGAGEGTSRVFTQVTDAPAETKWGRKRETFIDARDTFDTPELAERGQESLDEGAARASFTLETAEAEGVRFGTHYGLGDKVTVELLTGTTTVDVVRAARLSVALDGGVTVAPVVGNPDGGDPLFSQAAILSGLRRQVRRLEQRR